MFRVAPNKEGPSLYVWLTPQLAKLPSDAYFLSWHSDDALWIRLNVSARYFPRKGSFRLSSHTNPYEEIYVTAYGIRGKTVSIVKVPDTSLTYSPRLSEFRKTFNTRKQLNTSGIRLGSLPTLSRMALKPNPIIRFRKLPSQLLPFRSRLNDSIRYVLRGLSKPRTDYFDID